LTMQYSDAKKLAQKVIDSRPVNTVGDLSKLITRKTTKKSLNPATLPMLALRIAVNSELDNLVSVLPKAYDLLKKGGRLLVITFY